MQYKDTDVISVALIAIGDDTISLTSLTDVTGTNILDFTPVSCHGSSFIATRTTTSATRYDYDAQAKTWNYYLVYGYGVTHDGDDYLIAKNNNYLLLLKKSYRETHQL